MADYFKRSVNFGLGKVEVMENIIVPYTKMNDPKWEKVKHPSQILMLKIKKLNNDSVFNNVERKLLKAFKEKVEKALKSTIAYKKKAYIVVPPSKDDKENQMLLLIQKLGIIGEYEIIELASENYNLKTMNKSERINYLKNSYSKWTINNKTDITGGQKESFLIFVDDLLTTGTTSYFTIKAIQNLYGLEFLPLYRSIYLMGTKSSNGFIEEKNYDEPNFWKGMKGI